ncbi:ankyrin repeat domain-containing protein [Wolbachia endosymbiont (group E) of Neria commutata]|uniref:ankyrin repeat domain-containing protein n=1 Tax=Wolbachia endosymbiont (group E) of Neria commutata TaxID=3066149 RepID=UPI0031334C06
MITVDGFNSEFEIGRKDEDGATILHHTAQSDEEDLLKFIIGQGIEKRNPVHLSNSKNWIIKDAKGRSLLHYAAQSKTGNCLQFLINQLERDRTKYRIDLSQEINMQDEDGNTPLHYAAKEGNRECIELLCKRGAKIDLVDKNGMNPLHIASIYGHVSCIELLISHSKNEQDYINSKTLNGETPFLLAISGNHEDCAKLLKDAGGKIHACDNIRANALHLGAGGGIEYLNLVIAAMKSFDRIYNINACDEYGRTPLHSTRNRECFEALIQNGADFVDQGKLIRDHHNKTILHYVAASGNASFMEFLLKELKKHKVDISKEINHQDDNGRMPLYYAVDQENLEMVKLLLSINTQFAAEEIDNCIKGGLRKLLTYNVSNKDEILHTKDKYDKTIYDYVLKSNAIPVLKIFSDFSFQMKKLKKRFHDKLDNQFLSKFAYFSIIYTNIMALVGIRSFFEGDFFGKRELFYFAISVPIVNASLNNCLLYAKRKLNQSEKISNTYEEEIKKINTKIGEIQKGEYDETQDLNKQIQQYVEAAVGEGSEPDNQKKCLDDLKTTHNDKTPLQKKVAEILLSDLFCTKAQKRWKKAVRKTIDDIRIQKVAVKGINDQDMQNQKEYEEITKF